MFNKPFFIQHSQRASYIRGPPGIRPLPDFLPLSSLMITSSPSFKPLKICAFTRLSIPTSTVRSSTVPSSLNTRTNLPVVDLPFSLVRFSCITVDGTNRVFLASLTMTVMPFDGGAH